MGSLLAQPSSHSTLTKTETPKKETKTLVLLVTKAVEPLLWYLGLLCIKMDSAAQYSGVQELCTDRSQINIDEFSINLIKIRKTYSTTKVN